MQLEAVFRRYLPKGRLARAAIALGGATAVTQAIGIALSPVYTRLYSPADFGVFGIYGSLLSIFMTVGALCYEEAIPIADSDDDALDATILASAITIAVGLCAAAYIAFMSYGGRGSVAASAYLYLWLLPIGVWAGGICKALRYWALRRKAIGEISKTAVQQSVANHAVKMTAGLMHPDPWGLIVAQIVSTGAAIHRLAAKTMCLNHFGGWRRLIRFGGLRSLAVKYRKLPCVLGPSTLFNSLALFLPPALMAEYFGIEAAGLFTLAQRMISLPAGLIGGSIRQVFLSEAADVARHNPEALRPLFDKVVIKSLKLSVIFVILAFGAPFLFPIVFGARWKGAGFYAMCLGLYCAVGMCVSIVSHIAAILGRLRAQFAMDVTRTVAVFLAFYLPFRYNLSSLAAVAAYSAVMSMCYLGYYLIYRHEVMRFSKCRTTSWSD